jgi:hypothetical protein
MLKDLMGLSVGPLWRFVLTTWQVTRAPTAFAAHIRTGAPESRRASLRYFLEAAGVAIGTAWLLDRIAYSFYAGDGQQVLTVAAVFLMGALMWLVLKVLRTPGLGLSEVYHLYFYSHGAMLAMTSVFGLVVFGGLGLAVRLGSVPDLPPCDPSLAACCLEAKVPMMSSFADRVERADPVFRLWISAAALGGVVLLAAYGWVFALMMRRVKAVARWKSMVAVMVGFILYFAVSSVLVLVVLSKLYPAAFAACYPQFFGSPGAG